MPVINTGDSGSLSAIPQAPSINPLLMVADGRPLQSMSEGIDFGQKMARLSQFRDQLALEDLQRKAEAAKAKANAAEADLLHQNLQTQYAAKHLVDQNALTQGQIQQTQLGALQNVVVGSPDNPGTAATDANTSLIQSQTNEALARNYRDYMTGITAPVSPATAAGDIATKVPPSPVNPAAAADTNPYAPTSAEPLSSYLSRVNRSLVTSKLISKQSPIVTQEELYKAGGINTKSETFTGPDNRKYSTEVTYGPGGVRYAATAPIAQDIAPERKTELDRAPELADTNQALAAVDKTIEAVNAYKAAKAGGPMQTAGQIIASSPADGAINSTKRLAGISMQSPATLQTAAQLASLKGVFESAQRSTELRGLSPLVPEPVDLSNPDNAITKLTALRSQLANRAASLSSSSASGAITAKTGDKPAISDGEIRVDPKTGVRYRFDAAKHLFVPLPG